jgi:predicted component of type VI protein secretion system
MIQLIITLPDGSLVPTLPSELLEYRITIGSGVGNTLVVPHESVAETHVELLLDPEGHLVADLVGGGSTKINGHPVEPGTHYQLETGTVIQMGEVEAVYINADIPEGQAPGVESFGEENASEYDAMAVEEAAVDSAMESSTSAVAVAAQPVVAAQEFPPGGYPRPAHPAGVFVPRKAARSLWVMGSVAITFVAVAAACAAGYLSVVSGQH